MNMMISLAPRAERLITWFNTQRVINRLESAGSRDQRGAREGWQQARSFPPAIDRDAGRQRRPRRDRMPPLILPRQGRNDKFHREVSSELVIGNVMLQGGIEGGTGRIILSNIAMFSDGEPAQFESHPRSHIKPKSKWLTSQQ